MAYEKTVWVSGKAPHINAVNLNKLEQGVYDANQTFDALDVDLYIVEELAGLSGLRTTGAAQAAIVRNATTGGIFEYDSTRAGENDGADVIDGWVRQKDDKGVVFADQFGATADDPLVDSTAACHAAIDALGDAGGFVELPKGRVYANIVVQKPGVVIKGHGRFTDETRIKNCLMPFDTEKFALEFSYSPAVSTRSVRNCGT